MVYVHKQLTFLKKCSLITNWGKKFFMETNISQSIDYNIQSL